MRFEWVALVLIGSISSAQTPLPAPARAATVTVAPGTTVALTLVSTIRSKTTRPGDAVRAVVAFPVTVGTQLAIPAGTYVQGAVNAVHAHPAHGQAPSVDLRFTTLLFANGYSVTIDAINTAANIGLPEPLPQALGEIADGRDGAPLLGEGFAGAGQYPQPPTLPPVPQAGPNPAVVTGAVLGGGVGIMALTLILSHHHAGNIDAVLFDNGWQFQMAFAQPLTLDVSRVAEAATTPAAP
jgi:hypothetical protein